MKLVSATVGPFRSINSSQVVEIDRDVTVLVGMNEAGKTVFLKALHKAQDALGLEKFNPTDDYPRKDYTSYMKRHQEAPETAVALIYQLDDKEVDEINARFNTSIEKGFKFSVSFLYNNTKNITLTVDQAPVISAMALTSGLSTDAAAAIKKATSLRSVVEELSDIDYTDADGEFLNGLKARIEKTSWENVVQYEVWTYVSKLLPKFLYFSDYDLLPGKLNLKDLATRVANAKADPHNALKQVQPKHQAVLALLRMAEVDIDDFSGSSGYEELKAKVEAVSISLTDQVLEFWKQNEDLEVEVDIRSDVTDEAPFNDGPNLYLRIKNRRHRGVTTPFDQRSRGFIWFFSFLVWFDSVQQQLDPAGTPLHKQLILLLDEPGLALHALAQADFLRYIDALADDHQVIYTTHSPFMVHSNRLHQVRVVEDKAAIGTVISDNISGSDARTIFPLQAALGWNLAQNLFITTRNLLVEGPSELAYLQTVSALVQADGGNGLPDNITIVPVGGLNNVATFVSLLGANGLELAVLHDYSGKPEQKLDGLIQQRLLAQKSVFNASQFRDLENLGHNSVPSDIEDLFDVALYLDYFNKVYAKALGDTPILESDLPEGDRIVHRIERALITKKINVRPTGGFNHYAVAAAFSTSPPEHLSEETLTRFSALFKAISSAV
ncbi:AAA family ATPase [Pseudomonas sp. BC42]|uniref:AAA family ATPase n=1 Tax=Pseudomonas sp. BC42 TaxID=2933816 RepID=UPI001F2DE5AA|nr:AAA family ATPase [Pseudomonas sp. BC42]ULT72338.1 AAA family ATPase [Pseudomonas sp. BC42]